MSSQSQLRQLGMEADYHHKDSYTASETHQGCMVMTQSFAHKRADCDNHSCVSEESMLMRQHRIIKRTGASE